MKRVLQSCGWLLLVWSLMLTPQAALLHALSHFTPAQLVHESSKSACGECLDDKLRAVDEGPANSAMQDAWQHRDATAEKVCSICLAFAQLGAALPLQFSWMRSAGAPPVHVAPVVRGAALLPELAFRARAPPAALN